MLRTDIINRLIKLNNYKSYLEIGVSDPEGNFNKIQCTNKTGVDPEPKGQHQSGAINKMPSDQFFKENQGKFDIIFIDGLHTEDQVDKDVENALNCLNEGGTIVMHDCNPPTEYHQRPAEEFDGTDAWNGTVWRSWVKLRMNRNDLTMYCVDTDWGIGIIQRGKQVKFKIEAKTHQYEISYKDLEKHRKNALNLISIDIFKAIFPNKTVVYTCITDEYDKIQPPKHINDNYDYIVFTDSAAAPPPPWRAIKIDEYYRDTHYTNRLYKINPHKFLEQYDYSIYIDGNMAIRDDLDKLIQPVIESPGFIAFFEHIHGKTKLAEEFKACMIHNKWDDTELLRQMYCYMVESKYPDKTSLITGGFIFRKHNEESCINLMDKWWGEVKTFTGRDQLSFNYAAWHEDAYFKLWPKEKFYEYIELQPHIVQ